MKDLNKPWVIMDYDDTLGGIYVDGNTYMNKQAYSIAGEQFDDLMETFGFSREYVTEVREAIDISQAAQKGFGDVSRFAKSLITTYLHLCEYHNTTASHYAYDKIYQIGMSVFDQKFVLLPGARETVEDLKPLFRVAVVTKGDSYQQRRKVEKSGLFDLLDELFVVTHKDHADWTQVFNELQISPSYHETSSPHWTVGNSPKGDINIPVSWGINGLHVDQGGWHFEQGPLEQPWVGRLCLRTNNIEEVSDLILQHTLQEKIA